MRGVLRTIERQYVVFLKIFAECDQRPVVRADGLRRGEVQPATEVATGHQGMIPAAGVVYIIERIGLEVGASSFPVPGDGFVEMPVTVLHRYRICQLIFERSVG